MSFTLSSLFDSNNREVGTFVAQRTLMRLPSQTGWTQRLGIPGSSAHDEVWSIVAVVHLGGANSLSLDGDGIYNVGEPPVSPTGRTTYRAIVGGTGIYAGASGQLVQKERADGGYDEDFVFTVTHPN